MRGKDRAAFNDGTLSTILSFGASAINRGRHDQVPRQIKRGAAGQESA